MRTKKRLELLEEAVDRDSRAIEDLIRLTGGMTKALLKNGTITEKQLKKGISKVIEEVEGKQ